MPLLLLVDCLDGDAASPVGGTRRVLFIVENRSDRIAMAHTKSLESGADVVMCVLGILVACRS